MKTKLTLGLLLLVTALAIAATYSYRCPKYGNIQTFDRPNPGIKCSRDSWIMVQQ